MHPLDAISEPRRRELLALISERGEISVSDLAGQVDVTRPAVSQHLRILREAGIVVERRDGRRRLYRIDPRGLELARATIEAFLVDRLDELETSARADTPTTKESLRHA
ncbi:MAG: metalloregulator ArsR/SmtB family transcription factor [Acidimicrobiales bacterium]